MNSKKSQVYSYIDRQFIECLDHFDNEESLVESSALLQMLNNL